MNRINNELISRKALVNNIVLRCERVEVDGSAYYREWELKKVLNNMAIAFNKEKVIEELKECKYNSANCKKQCEIGTGEYIAFMSEEIAYQIAIEIVEKGGIE